MLYMVEMEVQIPHSVQPEIVEKLKREEKEMGLRLQREGRWRHLWRVVGRYANVSIFEVGSHAELHELLTGLPLFPFLKIRITPLTTHPSSLEANS